jgi:CRISPR-associated endonuclease/helicase Cas3
MPAGVLRRAGLRVKGEKMTDDQWLWAKKQDKEGAFYWLPLPVHLRDTMQVAGLLWDHWLSGGVRRQISRSLDEPDEERARALVCFLGAVHDIGKATPAFQTQQGYANSPDLDSALLERLERAGFGVLSAPPPSSPRESHHALAGQVILNEAGIRPDIASIVGAHHGKPVDDQYEVKNQLAAYPANYYQVQDPRSPVHQKWQRVQQQILADALQASGLGLETLPGVCQPGQVLLSGLLIMADWIASNERYFPLLPLEKTDVEDQTVRLQGGFGRWFKNRPLTFQPDADAIKLYEARFVFDPRALQQRVYTAMDLVLSPGIAILEAPMGCGKTEAALAMAEQMAAKTGRSGLFFGLPTQATSNGIFPRVKDWLEKVTAAGDEKAASLRLAHGKAALNPLQAALARKQWPDLRHGQSALNDGLEEGADTDADGYDGVFTNEWFSGRKTAQLDDVVVGTVDHFLLTALKQKHLALRHLGFSKKVVVIDEVHAYDVYMGQYLKEALRWMGAYGVPVILLSATLPAASRRDLMQAYLLGTGMRKTVVADAKALLTSQAYPLLTYSDGVEIKQLADFEAEGQKQVAIKDLAEDDLYDKIAALTADGGVVGVIVNTVRRAQTIAETCAERFGEDSVALLHSQFIDAERIAKEKALTDMIGKGARRPARKIIVGTQVMEQSLDIDFDVLISDLCPMDLLIQRVGRLHRHDIGRPKAHQAPALYVMGQSADFSFERGTSAVYGDYLLIRTQHFLPETLRIPGDISPLVQQVYGGAAIDLADPALQEKLLACRQENQTKQKNKSQKADVFRLADPELEWDPDEPITLMGWLSDSGNNLSEERAIAQVRDIQETVEVIEVKRCGIGYTCFGENEDVSGRIGEAKIAKKIAQQTLRLPHGIVAAIGADQLIRQLEQYNREVLLSWQKQPWLKGCLGIIFDESNHFQLNGIDLYYNEIYGLQKF